IHEVLDDFVHTFTVDLCGYLVVRSIWDRRGRCRGPVAGFKRLVDTFPHDLCGTFATGMANLHTDFSGRVFMHVVDNPSPGIALGISVDPNTIRGNAAGF